MTRDIIDHFVFDALADDIESLEQIIPSVIHSAEFWDIGEPIASFHRDRVVSSLIRLVRDDKVAVLIYASDGKELVEAGDRVVPDGSMDDFWFRLTPGGRLVHSAWDPPPERRHAV